MKKKNLIGLILTVIPLVVVFGLILTAPSENTGREQIYHARLADDNQYQDGIFTDTFPIKKGTYEFRFVLNGDSPQTLGVSLKGETFSFSEEFELRGTEHGEIGKYYTWEYLGQNKIEVPDDQELEITLNPHGSVLGPFSIYLIK
ncbi:MAG: hypothetical protein HZC29_03795 [Thaumarchaeota archaeon]|nr:hypothetical protein [Nitrososphaerota archaeon]